MEDTYGQVWDQAAILIIITSTNRWPDRGGEPEPVHTTSTFDQELVELGGGDSPC